MQVELKRGPKKTAIVSYGLRLSLQGSQVRGVDVFYLREYMMKVIGRSEVDIVTLRIKSDIEDNNYFVKDVYSTDLNDYDEVIIYNSVNNIFGGVFKHEAIETFFKLYDFTGDIWYFLCDPNLYPSDISKFIAYKRYGEPTVKTSKGPIEITDEYCENWTKKVFNRMNIMFAGCNYDLYVKIYNETPQRGTYYDLGIKDIRSDADWVYVPLFEYYAMAERLDQKLKNYSFERPYDLIYFGNKRASSRNKVIKKLYDNAEFHNYIVGYDPNFKNCTYDFTDYVNHEKLYDMIPSSAYATLVLGDDLHNNNIRTPRLFEALNLDIVAFIWIDYDKDKKFIKNDELKDFIYVSSYDEFSQKVKKIKSDETFFRHIVELERAEVQRTYDETIK